MFEITRINYNGQCENLNSTMYRYKSLLLLIMSVMYVDTQTIGDASQIMADLLNGYNKGVRPVSNQASSQCNLRHARYSRRGRSSWNGNCFYVFCL